MLRQDSRFTSRVDKEGLGFINDHGRSADARALGKIKPNDLVCAVAFGSGFTWGAVLMRW